MISILYVDDEPLLLDICSLFLERSGNMNVMTSLSAGKALEILASQYFVVIISDY